MKKRLFAVAAATVALSSSLTAFAAPATMKDGTVFDAEFYAQQNPDVVDVFGTDSGALYQHYTRHGKSEGRQAHMNDPAHAAIAAAATDTAFDAAFYAQQNPDVVAVFGTDPNALYQHYTRHGQAEGRQAHANDPSHMVTVTAAADTSNDAAFDAAYYAQQNPDVVDVFGTDSGALYQHYTNHGRSEGRKGHDN